MLESSARRPAVWSRTSGFRRTTQAVVCVVAAAVVVAGCASSKSDDTSAPKPSPTPLASLNTTTMQIPRIEFCKLIPGAAVQQALVTKPDSDSSYGNGDEIDLPGIGKQVVHEIGCSWNSDDGSAARAWVFARPVDAAFGRTVVADSKRTDGCKVAPGPAYGEPTVTQICRPTDGGVRVRHAGLFGQTWLTCEVADPT